MQNPLPKRYEPARKSEALSDEKRSSRTTPISLAHDDVTHTVSADNLCQRQRRHTHTQIRITQDTRADSEKRAKLREKTHNNPLDKRAAKAKEY